MRVGIARSHFSMALFGRTERQDVVGIAVLPGEHYGERIRRGADGRQDRNWSPGYQPLHPRALSQVLQADTM